LYSTATVRDVLALTKQHNISGVPVVDGNELVGIVTSRDLRFETRLDESIANVMKPKARLILHAASLWSEQALTTHHQKLRLPV
jgi:IMP dehydrogenase